MLLQCVRDAQSIIDALWSIQSASTLPLPAAEADGFCTLAVSILRRCPASAAVQLVGLEALAAVLRRADRQVRGQGEAVAATVTALARLPADDQVQETGLEVLGTLCNSPAAAARARAEGAVEAILSALRRFPSLASIQEAGWTALVQSVRKPATAKKEGMTAMQRDASCAGTLLFDHDMAAVAALEGVEEAAVAALRGFPESGAVRSGAFEVLLMLLCHHESDALRVKLFQAGVAEV